ncbi:BTB/POZ domain protein [Rhizoctonia solani 123E]|uniref:BTB/POZ domain protein n=1 Tax=Rhizoctonia solani 123E TaxID=1423351 RepID=A0A074RV01_9AGAM|nr:BTB/POZ domain protein [Rhizoctonia solani 123E]
MQQKSSVTLKGRTSRWVLVEDTSGANSNDTAPSAQESEPRLERHPEFFFDNTLVAIQIGTMLFNVHKYQLVKSEVFSDMFKIPKPAGDEPEEGSSPEHPITLEGVSASDFTALLRVLYASHFSSNQPAPEASLVIPAFRLANLFNFSELRAYLLPLAEQNLDDVDKIVFAREFDIKEWLVSAHVRLCQREKPLSGEEANKLGVQSVLIISRMREQHRSRNSSPGLTPNNHYCSACIGITYTGHTYDRDCDACGTRYAGMLRYDKLGLAVQGNTTTTDGVSIEAGVKKWLEDGCTID